MPKGKGSKQGAEHAYGKLQAYDEQVGSLRVVIESPRGCQNKYKLNEHTGLFDLHKVLPSGMSFPLDFGYVPATLADDGDPIDVLMFSDNPTFTGCVARVRLIGVIKAEQRGVSEPDWKKNHRLLAVALVSHTHQHVQTIDDIDSDFIEELEQFFVTYNKAQGKQFNLLGRGSKETAEQFVREAMARKAAVDSRAQSSAKKPVNVTRVVARTNVIPLGARISRMSSDSVRGADSSPMSEELDGTESGAQLSDLEESEPRARQKAGKSARAKRAVKSKKAGPSKRKKSTGVVKRAKKATTTSKTKKSATTKSKAKKSTSTTKRAKAKKTTGTVKRVKAKKAAGTKKTGARKQSKTKKAVAVTKATKSRKAASNSGIKKPQTRKRAQAKKPSAAKRPASKKATSAKKAKPRTRKAKPRAKKTALKPKKGVKISKLAKATRAKQKKIP